MVGKIYARQGRADACARIEAELEDRRARGEYIPRACDVIIATGRHDVPGLRRALQACIDEQHDLADGPHGPRPVPRDVPTAIPEVDALLDVDLRRRAPSRRTTRTEPSHGLDTDHTHQT